MEKVCKRLSSESVIEINWQFNSFTHKTGHVPPYVSLATWCFVVPSETLAHRTVPHRTTSYRPLTMALRLPARRLAFSGIRSFSSQASATSNLSQEVQQSINRDASLPNPDPSEDSPSAALVKEHAKYMLATYARPPPVFVKGEGSYLWDLENRKYLDFTAGIAVNGLGHSDPALSRIIADQANTLWHASNLYYNPWTGALSQLLVEKTLASGAMHDAATVFVCNSGSEANEAAIKFARKVGKTLDPSGAKHELVSFHGSFHGRTMGSLSATPNPKYQEPFAPMLPGCRYGTYNDVEAIDALVTDKTCGVIIEPIQGEGGVNVATDEFLVALAKRCREVGAVLVYDEIQCGLVRTGTLWAHGHLPKEAHPDVITTAKALGNGFPVGATVVNGRVSEAMKVGDHGTTFGGNPMACRLAHHVVSRLADPKMQEEVLAKSEVFRQRFEQMKQQFPDLITEVRGKGLMLGVQLSQDPTPIIKAARERGLLVITCGTNTLRFVPPLTISEEEIKSGLDILEEAIRVTR
ncbi:putative acetylornithine aminotransferase precursor [Xylariaceae sp. FL0016]|nr:putative acetylornithine aminotransferase precursor [Xylariaceae sp. FL0016]